MRKKRCGQEGDLRPFSLKTPFSANLGLAPPYVHGTPYKLEALVHRNPPVLNMLYLGMG